MENKYHKNDEINKYLEKAFLYVAQAIKARKQWTQAEIEDHRVKITVVRARMVTEVLFLASNARSAAELRMDSMEGPLLKKYFAMYVNKNITNDEGEDIVFDNGKTKKYTATIAESFARKALKIKDSEYYNAKKEFLAAKSFESTVYQLLKAMDQVANALSAVSK